MNNKKHIVTNILLIASLCFNIFFIGGYFIARKTLKKSRTKKGRGNIIAKRLRLTEEQENKYRKGIEILKRAKKENEEVYKSKGTIFCSEIIKNNPDLAILDNIIEEISMSRKKEMKIKVKLTLQLMEILNPEQQTEFVKLVKNRKIVY